MGKFLNNLNKRVKNLDALDVFLMESAVFAYALFILNLLPDMVAWMEVRHWGLFAGIALILFLRPFKKLYFSKN